MRDKRTGILVQPNQPEELASAMERLMNDAALRATLADNAYAEVKQRYDWHRIADEFHKLYCEILSSTRY